MIHKLVFTLSFVTIITLSIVRPAWIQPGQTNPNNTNIPPGDKRPWPESTVY